ncbi:MAG: DUF6293 family protein [Candidatus Helarchaeota archaeon]
MTYAYLIFVGHHKERLLASIKHWQKAYPPSKFILIIGKEKTTGEQKAELIAEEMQQELKSPLYAVNISKVNKLDLFQAIKDLKNIILPLKREGSKILLDISGSLRIFTVASLFLTHLTQCILVSVIPEYDEDFKEVGVERFINIPTLPLYKLKEEQYNILAAIGSGVDSIESLVLKISPNSKDDKKIYDSKRKHVAYYLNSLEDEGFISRTKVGKNTRTELTDLGEIYTLFEGDSR